jgi:autotransporter-associated beta strand protein
VHTLLARKRKLTAVVLLKASQPKLLNPMHRKKCLPTNLHPMSKATIPIILSVLCLMLGSHTARAAAASWQTAGDGNWTDTVNWTTGTVPTTGDTVTFNASGVNANENIFLNGNQAADSLTFTNTGTTTLLGGTSGVPASNTLTTGTGVTAANGGITISGSTVGPVTIGSTTAPVIVTLQSGTSPWNIATGTTLTVSNGIDFTAGRIQKLTGAGTLILSGSGIGSGVALAIGGVTYSNVARLDAGITQLNNAGGFGNGVVDIRTATLQAGTDLTGVNAVANTFVIATGSPTIGGSNNIQLSGSLVRSNGAGTPIVTVNNTGSTTLSGTVVLSDNATGGALTVNVASTAGTTTISGLISNGPTATSGTLNAFGAGTLIISGSNSFGSSGATTLIIGPNGGSTAVRATASGAFGVGNIFIAGNGGTNRAELAGGITLSNNFFINGKINGTVLTGTSVAASIENVSGTNTITGNITTQSGGVDTAIQSDAGLLTISGTLTSAASATREVSLQGNGNGLISGVITNGTPTTFNIIKTGSGTWEFSGANLYSGTTSIVGGKLRVSNTVGSATGTGSVVVSGSLGTATLAGIGFVSGTTTVLAGGRIAPGVNISGANGNFGVAGTLSTGTAGGGLTLTQANLDFDLAGSSATAGGGINDLISTSGVLTLTGSEAFNFNALNNTSLLTGTPYTLVSGFTSAPFASGDMTTWTTTFANGTTYTPSYAINGNALQVTFAAVPEPQTWAMMLGGTGMLVVLRRFRRRS